MKEKLVKWLKSLPFTLWFIIPYVLEHFFDINIREWLDKVPSSYYTIFLICMLMYSLVKLYIKKIWVKKENANELKLASINDYERVDSSIGFLFLFVIGYVIYLYFIKIPSLNSTLVVLILVLILIEGSFLKKTAKFSLEESLLHYKNDKIKRNFSIENLKELLVFTDKIEFIYTDNTKKIINHLELKNNDYKNLKTWSNKHLPYVEVAKGYY